MVLRVLIDGAGAKEAAEDLARAEGLDGSMTLAGGGEQDKEPTVLTVIVTIIQAAGGIAGIVNSVLAWRDRLARLSSPPRVVVYVRDHAMPLKELTAEKLTDLLESDPSLTEPEC